MTVGIYGSRKPNRQKASRQKLFAKKQKPLTKREAFACYLRTYTKYSEPVIERILKMYDKCPEVYAKKVKV